MFALWNMLGAFSTIAIASYMIKSDTRLREINRLLEEGTEGGGDVIRSPMPVRAARTAYWANGIAMASLFAIWLVLLIKTIST